MRHIIQTILIPAMIMALAAPAAAGALDVEEIINKANLASYYGGDDGRAEVTMTITDDQGRTRNREFVILRKDQQDGGAQLFYVYFKKPSDVRKMAFMVHKNPERDDDRWLYLPALDLVKRIAASDKRTSFVGTHFFYEDVSGRGVDEDVHELLETTDAAHVVKNTPKDADSVRFSHYLVWIDKNDFVPRKAEYFDKNGKKYRVVEALRVETIDGLPTVTLSVARDLENNGSTTAEFKNIRYNVGLKEDIFTERYLRRAPREVRK